MLMQGEPTEGTAKGAQILKDPKEQVRLGVRSAAVSGSGVFKDETTDAAARDAVFNGQAPSFQVIVPEFGTIEGAFQITSLEYAGNHDGEATYELSLASAGALSFTAL